MATHSSILAWRIPWTKEPGRLLSIGLQRVRHDLVGTHGLWPARLLVHAIPQARIPEWVTISFSKGSLGPRDRTCIS